MDQRIVEQMTASIDRLNELKEAYHPDVPVNVVEIAGRIVKAVSALRLVESSMRQAYFRSAQMYIQRLIVALNSLDGSEITVPRIECLVRAIGRLQSTMSLNIAISSTDLNHLERALTLQGLVSDGRPSQVGQA